MIVKPSFQGLKLSGLVNERSGLDVEFTLKKWVCERLRQITWVERASNYALNGELSNELAEITEGEEKARMGAEMGSVRIAM